ncbi:hypothetical protein AB4589_25495, partial [Vibrio sp. 10N.222.49.A3]|uniref:hypothetical protein n=1 Tax=Vibrio sp. 10N.222.49.A3 TaxID=3229611 RepID=UPI003551C079
NTHQIKMLILKKINGVLMLALLLLDIINILIILISLPQCAINFSNVICYLSVIYRFFIRAYYLDYVKEKTTRLLKD